MTTLKAREYNHVAYYNARRLALCYSNSLAADLVTELEALPAAKVVSLARLYCLCKVNRQRTPNGVKCSNQYAIELTFAKMRLALIKLQEVIDLPV